MILFISQTIFSATIKIRNIGSITISKSGAKSVLKLPVIGTLELQGNLDSESDEKTISAKLSSKTFYPFKRTQIKKLKDISLKDPEIILKKNGSEYEITLKGTVRIFGKDLIGTVLYQKGAESKGWVAILEIPGSISPFSFVPGLRVFKKLSFKKSYIIASTIEYEDEKLGATIEKGVGFLTTIPTTGPLKAIQSVFRIKKGEISLYGAVTAKNIQFRARLAGGSKSKSARIKFGKLELELAAKPIPSFAVLASIYVKPSKNDSYLEFIGKMGLSPVDVRVSGTMKNTWTNPFRIKGISIADTALEGAINIQSGLPAALGFTGKINIFGKKVKMALLVDLVNLNNSLIQFSLNEISLKDMVLFAKKIGLRLPKKAIPQIAFKNIAFKIAPMGGQIGEISFDQGISFQGEANILKAKVKLAGVISKEGITASGGTSEMNILGVLKLKASSKDTKAKKGPYVELELSPKKQHLNVSGSVSLFGVKSDTYLKIGPVDAKFSTSQKIGGWFESSMSGLYKIGKSPDFALSLSVKNNIKKKILNKIRKIKPLKFALSKILKTFNITSIKANGSLHALIKGQTPKLIVKYTIFKRRNTLKLAANLKKPMSLVDEMIKEIKKSAHKNVLKNMKQASKERKLKRKKKRQQRKNVREERAHSMIKSARIWRDRQSSYHSRSKKNRRFWRLGGKFYKRAENHYAKKQYRRAYKNAKKARKNYRKIRK